jgi:hypothetical protein
MTAESYAYMLANINSELHRVQTLDFSALLVAMTSFAYPLRLITRIIYCKLTERKRHFKADEWVELIFASATFAWLAHYVVYKY